VHPNAQGHALIFDNLYARLKANPNAWAALVGNKEIVTQAQAFETQESH
jgi:hypothetical protein